MELSDKLSLFAREKITTVTDTDDSARSTAIDGNYAAYNLTLKSGSTSRAIERSLETLRKAYVVHSD